MGGRFLERSPIRYFGEDGFCVLSISGQKHDRKGAFAMAGYIVYWAKDYVKRVEKAGDQGPFKVVYGSQHTVMPSIASVKAGDIVYPVTIQNGTLAVMARLPVEKTEPAFDYTLRELGRRYAALVPEGVAYYSRERFGEFVCWRHGSGYAGGAHVPDNIHTVYREWEISEVPHLFHQVPKTCCAEKAASGEGSEIFPREIPIDVVKSMLFGPSKSKRKPLLLNKSGGLASSSLSGFVRKMSGETMEVFERLF